MRDRGATEKEVISAIEEGSSEPARKGRILFRKNFAFNNLWRGKKYSIKQVAPIVKVEKDNVVIITVYEYYLRGGNES